MRLIGTTRQKAGYRDILIQPFHLYHLLYLCNYTFSRICSTYIIFLNTNLKRFRPDPVAHADFLRLAQISLPSPSHLYHPLYSYNYTLSCASYTY